MSIEKIKSKIRNKIDIHRIIAMKFVPLAIFLAALLVLVWKFNLLDYWYQIETISPLGAKLIKVAIIWIGAVYSVRVSLDVFSRAYQKVKKIPAEVAILFRKLITYGIYSVAIVLSLLAFELLGAIQGLLVGAGFAGIVVGLAAQKTISNLIAGITLMIDHPFKIGDWIHLKGQNIVGTVKKMTMRSITIIAPDNTPVNLPNSMVANEALVNYSTHKLRRFFLEFKVPYDVDMGKAMRVVKHVLQKDPATAKEGIRGQGYFAPIEIVVTDFGKSSIGVQAKVFIDTTAAGGLFETKSRMLTNIKDVLLDAGIEIPYPKMSVDLHKKKK